MYIDANTIVTTASLVGATLTLGGLVLAAYRWYLKQNKQDADIKSIKEEQCMHTYVLLAVLYGLKQQGCNRKVTEAQDKLSKHINWSKFNESTY